MPLTPGNVVPPLLVSFIAWRAYRRFNRNIGRQPLRTKRIIMRIVIYSVITLVVAVDSILHLPVLRGLGIGLLLGVPLAFLGLHLTQFENTPAGRFYTPNTYIGIILSVLLMGRLVYRFGIFYANMPTLGNPNSPAFVQSPLTVFFFGLLASYRIAYYAGILLRSRD
ncbi:MAG TPA: DUF1453 domain-containing protein [Verrucomicrobiae bacterium]|jgi:hypothetical protein|nr:DUF1453 domain-containing protein [Verrucomicrobiae bacterium]